MSSVIENITSNEDLFIPFLIFGGVALVAVVMVVFDAIKRISINGEREKSRREIAAYVAEGSMTPDDGIRLMNAANDKATS